MAKKFVLIKQNIINEIMDNRRKLFGPEQIIVFIKGNDKETYDILEMLDLFIGMKIGVTKEFYDVTNPEQGKKTYYGEIVSFKTDEVTDENIQLAINYLSQYKLTNPLIEGVPTAYISIDRIKQESVDDQLNITLNLVPNKPYLQL